jgi:hypothetical protein
VGGTLTYDPALDDHFAALPAAHEPDTRAIWSSDGVHLDHLPVGAR